MPWYLTAEIHQCIAFHHHLSDINEKEDNGLGLYLTALFQVSELVDRLRNGTCKLEGIKIFHIPADDLIGLERDDSTI